MNPDFLTRDRVESDLPPETAVDRLLREFYRHEMPRDWPALRVPESKSAKPRSGWKAGRSYLALAASLAFLVLGLTAGLEALRGPAGQGTKSDPAPLPPTAGKRDPLGRPIPPTPMPMPPMPGGNSMK